MAMMKIERFSLGFVYTLGDLWYDCWELGLGFRCRQGEGEEIEWRWDGRVMMCL